MNYSAATELPQIMLLLDELRTPKLVEAAALETQGTDFFVMVLTLLP